MKKFKTTVSGERGISKLLTISLKIIAITTEVHE